MNLHDEIQLDVGSSQFATLPPDECAVALLRVGVNSVLKEEEQVEALKALDFDGKVHSTAIIEEWLLSQLNFHYKYV